MHQRSEGTHDRYRVSVDIAPLHAQEPSNNRAAGACPSRGVARRDPNRLRSRAHDLRLFTSRQEAVELLAPAEEGAVLDERHRHAIFEAQVAEQLHVHGGRG